MFLFVGLSVCLSASPPPSNRFDEQVNLLLSSSDPSSLPELERKFVRVSCLATITHLKKFLAIKVLGKEVIDEDEDKFR